MILPSLLSLVDGKDNYDKYLLGFQRNANVAKWKKQTWATQLSPLLTCKAVKLVTGCNWKKQWIINALKFTLLAGYDFTKRGAR